MSRKKSVFRSAAEKRSIVDAYFARGERSGREVARELGVPVQLIYNWKHKIDNGESLGPEEPAAPKASKEVDAKMTRALGRAKQAMASRLAAKETPEPRPLQSELIFEERPAAVAAVTAMLKQENQQLRRENAQLKRALAAMLTDH